VHAEGPRRSRLSLSQIVSAVCVFALCFGAIAENPASKYDEPFRPQFHYTPPQNWTNDPNGPVYVNGEYHLFYQFNPFANEWGHMTWGHAVARDMVHWKTLKPAIPEENGIMIFSGSTVVDRNNTSGLCKDAKGDCMVAVYTGHTDALQTQNLAYSSDYGRTWTKYSENPVINLKLKDFRDPKVFWHEQTRKWVMVAALSPQHKVRFFGSQDLKHWKALSDFGPAGATGGVWECPDLFPLAVEGEAGQKRWVLSVNLNPGGVAGGSGNQYFVGQFDGTKFTAEKSSGTLWADYGKDFYASTSIANMPYERRVWIAWMDNWDYAKKEPTSPWRGAQTIPRELGLRRVAGELRLMQKPVSELKALRERRVTLEGQSVASANATLKAQGVSGKTLEIEAEVDVGSATEAGFTVLKGASEETVVGVDAASSSLIVDRTHSGNVSFDPSFSARQTGPLQMANNKRVKLHIFVDRSSVEVFANDGATVMTSRVFPSAESKGVELYSRGGDARVVSMTVWTLRSAWH